MDPILMFTGSTGINNIVDPVRLPYNQETGVAALEEATDVLIDRSGSIVTVRGNVLVQAGAFHSTYPHSIPNNFYVVKDRDTDSALYRAIVNSDGTVDLAGIRSGLTRGAKMAFCRIAGTTYYGNGYERGVIVDDVSDYWPVNKWTGDDTEGMISPPVGQHLGVLSKRILLSVDDEIFYTEVGLPGLIDENKNRRKFESKILMICSVLTGVFVSDERAVYFLAGIDPNTWTVKKVLDYPAVEWAMNPDLINPSFFGLETAQLSGMFGTVKGPVIGLPDGSAYNLIDKKVVMPTNCGMQTGSIMFVDETTIIQSGV